MDAYDIREIRLIKSHANMTIPELLNQAEEEAKKHPEVKLESWLCLGHFDLVQIRAIACGVEKNPLSDIRNAVKRTLDESHSAEKELHDENVISVPSSNYIDPLYALKPMKTTVTPELFLPKENRRWMLLARIHCDWPDEEDLPIKKSFTQQLIDDCEQFCKNQKYEDFSLAEEVFSYSWFQQKQNRSKKVLGCFYETLELGDILCFLKSDVLPPLLELAQYIYGRKYISDVYSYVCVNCTRIPYDGFTEDERKDLRNLKLSQLSTRFSVRLARAAQSFLNDVKYAPKGSRFYVAGTADLMIQWDEKNEYALMCWVRNLLTRMKEKPTVFYEAFYDVITRVGVEYQEPKNCREKDLPSSRLAAFDRVVDYSWLYQEETKLPSVWGPTLKRLLATLRTMSANSAMDDLAAMLIPGVQAFLTRLKKLNKDNNWDERWNGTITYFLERWMRLADDMLHLESQLTQHSELSPTPHAIPAMLLLFEQRFVRQAAELLEGNESGGFVPVIFPYLTDHIRTRSVLNPHDGLGTEKCPLSIEAPVEQLFSPYVIAHILVHEVAHYCGVTLRKRDVRLDCMCRCYAYAIVQCWNARIRENCFQSKLPSLPKLSDTYYEELAERVKKHYRQMLRKSEAESLKEIKQYLHLAAIEVACEHTSFESYQGCLIANIPLQQQLAYAKMEYWLQDYTYFTRFTNDLTEHGDLLYHLYKECYADIAMICLLNCKPSDYYDAVFGVEMRRLSNLNLLPQPNAIMRRHRIRLRLVAETIGETDWRDMGKEKEAELKATPYSRSATEPVLGFTISEKEYAEILAYLNACKQELKKQLTSEPKVTELRRIYSATQPEHIDWNVLRHYAEDAAREWREN